MCVSDPWVQLAPACSLISQHDPCCCTDTLTLTQRNQRDSFKCLSVSAGDQCFLWREHQHRRGGSGEGEWRQESEWMGGGETQDGTRGEEGDVVSKVIDGWSQTERYYLRRLGDLWPHKTLCEDNSSHICFETKRARDRESEGQRERERSWGRGVFVKDKRLVSTIIRERERETLPADWLSTSSVFRLYLYSYRNLSRKT